MARQLRGLAPWKKRRLLWGYCYLLAVSTPIDLLGIQVTGFASLSKKTSFGSAKRSRKPSPKRLEQDKIATDSTCTYTGAPSTEDSPHVVNALAKLLGGTYQYGGTLAVMERCRDGIHDYPGIVLVQAAVLASQGHKGVASGILNALLGACCTITDDSSTDNKRTLAGIARQAVALMDAYDSLSNDNPFGDKWNLQPDLVALCLAYTATDSLLPTNVTRAFLERAQKLHDGELPNFAIEPTPLVPLSNDWKEKLVDQHNIQVLQDTTDFVVISKPSGMVCYHAKQPRQTLQPNGSPVPVHPRHRRMRKHPNHTVDPSVEDCLLCMGVPLSTLNGRLGPRGIVHRLDRGTSGCLVLAKTNTAHARLVTQFFLRNLQKSYQALVVGRIPSSFSTGGVKGHSSSGLVVSRPIDGRPAQSSFVAEKEFFIPHRQGHHENHTDTRGKFLTRLQVQTIQGRRHQIRLHCAEALNSPILLDPLYGGEAFLSSAELSPSLQQSLQMHHSTKNFFLHASHLVLPKEKIDVRANLPDWWLSFEEEIRDHS